VNHKIASKLIEMAKAMKGIRATGKSWHISAAVRQGRIACIGWNDYRRHHNWMKWGRYLNIKSLPGKYLASVHSECSLATKLGEENWEDYSIYNIRIDNNGNPNMSRPCANCMRCLVIPLRPRNLFFTNALGQFEELEIN